MPILTQASGVVVDAPEWNQLVAKINACPPGLEVTVTTLDANGSLVMPTGEETDLNLDATAGGNADVNGCTVPARAPWPLYLVLISNHTITLKHEDSTEPTPAKRFRLPGNADVVLTLGEGITLRYKSTPAGARWVAVTKG